MTFSFDNQGSPVCADIGEAPNRRGFVRCENERLVETPFEQSERKDVARGFDAIGVANPLPAPRKDRVFLKTVVGWV